MQSSFSLESPHEQITDDGKFQEYFRNEQRMRYLMYCLEHVVTTPDS